MSKALDRLRQIFGGGIYNPNTNIFDEIDLDAAARELNIDREASTRGKRNVPQSDAQALDDVETKAVALIEAQRSRTLQLLNEQFRGYDERLAKYDGASFPAQIETTAIAACTDLYVDVHKDLDKLHDLRKGLIEEERSLNRFRAEHELHDPARYPEARVLHVAFVLLLLLAESLLNGLFLAQGDEGGIVGGVTIALGIAMANVGSGFVVGRRILPLLIYKGTLAKIAGALGGIGYCAIVIVINFGAAHYRDAVLQVARGSDIDPARVALDSLIINPMGVADLKSWMMLGLGIAFSIAAAVDGWSFDESYPGYGARWRRVKGLRDEYTSEKDHLQNLLGQTRDDAVQGMEEAATDLSNRSKEIGAIGLGRQNLLTLCRQHLGYLQECANQLVTRYREKNKQYRTTDAPAYWADPIILTPIELPLLGDRDQKAWQRFEKERIRANTVLVSKTQEINEGYREAVEKYHTIEQLTSDGDVPAQSADRERSHVA